MIRRGGFTLVEIILAIALMLIVTGAIHRLLLATQRLSRAQVVHASLQSNVRSGILVTVNELRELNTLAGGAPDHNDVVSFNSTGISYRVSRGFGFLCQAAAGNQLRIAQSDFSAHRNPQALRDAAYLFVEGDQVDAADDRWLPLPITSVSLGSACPGGPGITLTTAFPVASPGAPSGTPVRIYETMELRSYQSNGSWWLGARSVSAGEVIQPLAGPLAGGAGFRLEYLNAAGAATADPTAVRAIRVAIRAVSESPMGAGGAAPEEELTTQVTLRNPYN